MAEIIDEFPRQKYGKYAWAEWFDGRIWRLKEGVDYTIDTAVMARQCVSKGKMFGYTVRVSQDAKARTVTVQRVLALKAAI